MTDPCVSLFEDVLAAGHQAHRQPQEDGQNRQQPRHRRARRRGLPEEALQHAEGVVARQGVRDQRLQLVRHGELAQVAGQGHRDLLPAEGEDQADDQRPLQHGADEREERAVGGQAEGQQRQVE